MSTARRLAHTVEEVVLTVLSILGALCVVLVVLALVFDVTLIMFKTGSMSPTIPAGSVAIVREIPASEVNVGDVVTVDRPGQLPVTHRVTSVTEGPAPDQRILTMKGDANEAEDLAPYTVSTVRTTMASIPGLAPLIVRMSNPYVLGAVTIGASLLVVWAFWPRGGSGENKPGRLAGKRAIPGESPGRQEGPARHAIEPGRRRRRRVGVTVTVLVALALAGVVVLALALPASAAGAEVVRGKYLTLESIPDPRMTMMGPGETVHWQVGVSVEAPDPGTVSIGLSATGDPSMELTAAATACSVRWDEGKCAGKSWQLPDLDPIPIDGVERELLTMPSDQERWVMLAVTMRPSADPAPGDGVSALLHASGQGDSVAVGPGGLARTGGPSTIWPVLLALGAITMGLALTLRRKRRNERDVHGAAGTGGRP